MLTTCRLSILWLALLLLAVPALAEDITPPFGLQWGESSERIQTLLTGAKAKTVEKKDIADRQVWVVEGLVQAGLKRTLFYFKSGLLNEVELQYESPEWDARKYDDFMAQVRRRLDQKFGQGRLIARSHGPEADVTQTVVGYKWQQTNRTMQLFYYSAERGTDIFRTISVHYKDY